jgi:TetR/AcrR family tetracycline transcriptional repressor
VTVSPSRPGLSEETLVAAAIRIARRDGIESVTMRALAAELGVTQMAAYYYFSSKEELLEEVVDGILASIQIPQPGSAAWDELLRQLIRAELRELAKYRGIGHLLPSQNASPAFLILARACIDILVEGGFSTEQAFMAFDTIHSQVLGRLLLLDRLRERHARRLDRLLGLRLPKRHFEDYADFAADVIVSGLKQQALGARE